MRVYDEYFVSVTFITKRTAVTCFDSDWKCLFHGEITTKQSKQKKGLHLYKGVDCLEKYHINGHQKSLLCTDREHFPDSTSKFGYCAQKQNTFTTVHQKCVLCTETEQFPDGKLENCTVHRNRTLSRRYIEIRVRCTETGHYPDGTTEMFAVHRKKNLQTVQQKPTNL